MVFESILLTFKYLMFMLAMSRSVIACSTNAFPMPPMIMSVSISQTSGILSTSHILSGINLSGTNRKRFTNIKKALRICQKMQQVTLNGNPPPDGRRSSGETTKSPQPPQIKSKPQERDNERRAHSLWKPPQLPNIGK